MSASPISVQQQGGYNYVPPEGAFGPLCFGGLLASDAALSLIANGNGASAPCTPTDDQAKYPVVANRAFTQLTAIVHSVSSIGLGVYINGTLAHAVTSPGAGVHTFGLDPSIVVARGDVVDVRATEGARGQVLAQLL